MAVSVTPTSPTQCQTFTVDVTALPVGVTAGVDEADFYYDGQSALNVPLVAPVPPATVFATATFTAQGTGPQTVTVVYHTPAATPPVVFLATDVAGFTVNAAPAATTTITLGTLAGPPATTTATTTLACSVPGGLATIDGTLTYTLPGGGTVGPITVTNGIVGGGATPVVTNLGVLLTSGQTVTAAFTPDAGACPQCTVAPASASICSVTVLPPTTAPVVGQVTSLTATVLCNGVPVPVGTPVQFLAGGVPIGSATTNAAGTATGTVTFPTAGAAISVTAVATAASGTCSCSGVSSAAISVAVAAQANCTVLLIPPATPVVAGQPTTLTAAVLCNGLPINGATVDFTSGTTTLGSADTNALGLASITATFPTAGAGVPITATASAPVGSSLCACASQTASTTITVVAPASCSVIPLPPASTVTVGTPTTLRAVVLCNGTPIDGATVTFTSGTTTLGSADTNALGIAAAPVTFTSSGSIPVVASVSAPAGSSACACTDVTESFNVPVQAQSTCTLTLLPVTGTVTVGTPTTLRAIALCNGAPINGATVTFTSGTLTLATATTNALGFASAPVTFTTAGSTTVNATVLAPAGSTTCSCTNVAAVPAITFTVQPQSTCTLSLLPPTGTVTVGTPTTLQAVALCNGVPINGAAVTFTSGGVTIATATTNSLGVASAPVTFGTAGSTTVNATVLAPADSTTCSCTNVAAVPPITFTVQPQSTGALTAFPACWRTNLPIPFPDLFTANLRAALTPAAAGVTVEFFVGGQSVGTAVTDASGNATLTAGLGPLQIINFTYQAVATVGSTRLQASAPLTPCIPPV